MYAGTQEPFLEDSLTEVKTIQISLPYGKEKRLLSVPETMLAWVLAPKDMPGVPDVATAVRAALRDPIGSPPLIELARGQKGRVVIVVDDNTRSTPQNLLMPHILSELNEAGIEDEQITVLVALGTHRPMTESELRSRLGNLVVDRVSVQNLDSDNASAFLDLGTTKSGIPIQIARLYYEADLKIAVGNIIPHMYAGWSGGAKLIQPGVCSPLTTCKTHLLGGLIVHQTPGTLNNPVRQEIDEIGLRSGLSFIVNTVLNGRHEVVRVVAGHPIMAHREGVATARLVFGAEVPELADIVVASSFPADRDMWQGPKPLNTAGMTVRPGGEVLLLIPAPEGFSPDHEALPLFGRATPDEVMQSVARGECKDEVAAATYLAMSVTRARARITLVSKGIEPRDTERLGFGLQRELDRAFATAMRRAGPRARIGVITQAGDILPLMSA